MRPGLLRGIIIALSIEAIAVLIIWAMVSAAHSLSTPTTPQISWFTCQTKYGDLYDVDTPDNRAACNGKVVPGGIGGTP